jgi:hypothetical protein
MVLVERLTRGAMEEDGPLGYTHAVPKTVPRADAGVGVAREGRDRNGQA